MRALPEDGLAEEVEDPETDVVEPPRPAETPQFLLKQEGNSYHVRDEAMLQRWIAERRVWPDDELSVGGGTWARVGSIEKYAVFFKLVDEAERSAPSAESARESQKPAGLSVAVKPGLFAKPASMGVPNLEPHTDGVSSSDQEEPKASTQSAAFGEVVPDEAPGSLSMSPDEPTMDMELADEDFFSEEQSAVANRSGFPDSGPLTEQDDDELFEWKQHRRRNMVMWWLMFMGALGAVAYLSLDFLNKRDQAKVALKASTEVPESADVEKSTAAPPDSVDTGAVPADAPIEPPVAPPAEEESDPEPAPAAEPETKPKPTSESSKGSSAPSPTKSESKPTPRTVNVSAEVKRGWAQIDRSNWAKARIHFENVLRAQPGNQEGRYGMAYVNEKQGRVAEAVAQYCRLAATASGETKIEVAGRLRALAKDCP